MTSWIHSEFKWPLDQCTIWNWGLKFWPNFSNKVLQKCHNKSCTPSFIFFNEKKVMKKKSSLTQWKYDFITWLFRFSSQLLLVVSGFEKKIKMANSKNEIFNSANSQYFFEKILEIGLWGSWPSWPSSTFMWLCLDLSIYSSICVFVAYWIFLRALLVWSWS